MIGICKLYAYNRWANDRVLTVAESLSQEELGRNLDGSFGSLWETLVHIFGVEWLYPQRWNGIYPSALPQQEQFADLAALQAFWDKVRTDQQTFIDGLNERVLQQPVEYVNFRGEKFTYPLVDQMRHLVNHSTYHRGQVTLQLRMLGKEPLSTDLLLYLDERNEIRGKSDQPLPLTFY
jgi:uncharacterized damage-inducible protein DinB